jgi:predicted CoA-binding protein
MKTDRAQIEEFTRQKKFAVVGVSREPKKFGSNIFKELSSKGYDVIPVNPNMTKFDNHDCYKNLREIPEKLDGVIIVVPPEQAEIVVKDAAAAGIPRVWFQQGSESASAIAFCADHGIKVVAGKCVMMFAHPVTSIHRFHRFIWNLFHR